MHYIQKTKDKNDSQHPIRNYANQKITEWHFYSNEKKTTVKLELYIQSKYLCKNKSEKYILEESLKNSFSVGLY